MKNIYAVLDIGSATLKFLVAEISNINVNVLFVKTIPSHGVKKGIIEDDRILTRDIRKVIDEAETFLETKITSVALTIPTIKAKLYQSDSSVSLSETGSKITSDDIVRVLRLSSKFKRSKDEEVVSIIPVRYHSDKGATIEAPIGEVSRNLIVDSLVITTSKELLYPYISVVEKCGIEVLDITINAFACAKEAFDAVYLQEGAVLIDMGYKTSTVSFYKDGYLQYLTVCQVGGYDFTRNIAQNMQISMNQAEAYKIKYGSLDVTKGQNDIIHTTVVEGQKRDYTQQDLADLLNETAYEVMNKIKEKIDVIDNGGKYETLIVGGGGELERLDTIASEVLECPVRIYRPETIGARDMSLVASIGMIYYLLERKQIVGEYTPSLVLPDITSTMSIRFKGLTKSTPKNQSGKVSKLLDTFFSED
ncbi:cell division protein FtsA [Thomasclavelia cocleata]|uniref:Cell division protein FtsA n=1 Tax=Thomasclavelia cocleata TaxID=69824 RepID=A0A1I0HEL2_9FIRM|nr:cell division protein FtsA [Thomasclavelia cocleata]MCR1961291.1 cell division protein FtsA [Thomasclavelia cocleata]NDO42718.1 cell division protein FtsA [Thomasclavelia cocleata]PJN79681.1 cell division protein FtsA [Thomasclavelia cocleata]SET82350.1 cell division protein FtsA [Thomasclavelia cocleata]